jgi:hypothetical protein
MHAAADRDHGDDHEGPDRHSTPMNGERQAHGHAFARAAFISVAPVLRSFHVRLVATAEAEEAGGA